MSRTIPVGRVLGTEDATPLEFWVALAGTSTCSSTTSSCASATLPGRDEPVRLSGRRHPGAGPARGRRASTPTCSSIADGVLPAEAVEAAEVTTTRVEPEVFVPPRPGARVRRADGRRARPGAVLRPDGAAAPDRARPRRRAAVRSTSTSSTAPAARTSTSPASPASRRRPLTRPSCSTRSSTRACSATTRPTRKALIFNVKGEDLLFLDHANTRLDDATARRTATLGLDAGRVRRRRACTRRRAPGDPNAHARRRQPHARRATASTGRSPSSSSDDLLPFVFADAEDDRQQYTMVVHNVAAALQALRREPATTARGGSTARRCARTTTSSTSSSARSTDEHDAAEWAGAAIGMGTINAFVRRLLSSQRSLDRLVRADLADARAGTASTPPSAQVTVVDLHNLPDRAKRFVVGVTLRARVRAQGAGRHRQAAAVRRARRAQQVRAARRRLADQGDPARRRRARPLARHRADRRAADRERGRAAHHRQLVDPRRRPPRPGRGDAARVRLPARRRTRSGRRSPSPARCS